MSTPAMTSGQQIVVAFGLFAAGVHSNVVKEILA